MLCERSERAANKLDKFYSIFLSSNAYYVVRVSDFALFLASSALLVYNKISRSHRSEKSKAKRARGVRSPASSAELDAKSCSKSPWFELVCTHGPMPACHVIQRYDLDRLFSRTKNQKRNPPKKSSPECVCRRRIERY